MRHLLGKQSGWYRGCDTQADEILASSDGVKNLAVGPNAPAGAFVSGAVIVRQQSPRIERGEQAQNDRTLPSWPRIALAIMSWLCISEYPRPQAGEAKSYSEAAQRQRPHSFLNVAFIYADDDLLSHTRVARAPRPRKLSLKIQLSFSLCGRPPPDVHRSQTRTSRPFYAPCIGGRGRPPHTTQYVRSATYQIPLSPPPPASAKRRCSALCHFLAGARIPLPESARDMVLEHVAEDGWRIHLYAIVVMPDHVHLLFHPLRDNHGWAFPLVDIMQCVKGATAHRINKLLHRSGPVWEEESFDHVLRSDESLKEKTQYIGEPRKKRTGKKAPRLSLAVD